VNAREKAAFVVGIITAIRAFELKHKRGAEATADFIAEAIAADPDWRRAAKSPFPR
jgi:hypothetical protein